MVVETEHLLIRDTTAEDWRDAMSFLGDPEVMRWIHLGPAPFTEAQAHQWISDLIFHNHQQLRFAHNSMIVERETQHVIGWIGIGKPSHEGIGDLDFGYALAREYWSKGYMTEALRAVLNFGFSELGANIQYAICEVINTGSSRVMEKAGMKQVKRYIDEDQREMFLYTISKDQWFSLTSG